MKSGSHRNLVQFALHAAPAIFLIAALWILGRELHTLNAGHVWSNLGDIAPSQWLAALAATICGYGILTFYDVLGLRVVGAPLPYHAAAEGAFLSFAVSHNVGFGWISGGSMRERVYRPLGVPLADVARLTILNSLTFFIGAFVLAGGVLIAEPRILEPLLPLSSSVVRFAGAALWLAVAAYLLLCARRRRPIGWGDIKLPVPGWRTGLVQAVLSCADITLAAVALYALLPQQLDVSFPLLLGVYTIALGASVLTHVPGGLGVLETLILWSLPDAPKAPLLAALIGYRIVYYLIPLATALVVILIRSAPTLGAKAGAAARGSRQLVPVLAAALGLAAGAYLLLSGASPAWSADFRAVRAMIPLPLLELSHLAGSLVGLVLVILAGALYRRYDTARDVAITLLIAGAAATLIRDQAMVAALVLLAAAATLKLSSAAFYRRGSLWRNAVAPSSIALGLLVLAVSIWAGFRTYAGVAYSHDLWWQFASDAEAPRFLRASLFAGLLGFGLLLLRLLGPARESRSSDEPTAAVRQAVAASMDTTANLALVGDKKFLVSDSGRSFLMYQVQGRSWIAMGDPVGPRSEWAELTWRFLERADIVGGRPVFYEALGENLDLYSDAGLAAHKIGEEARVDLDAFTLEGSPAKAFRAMLRRGEREGLLFEILPARDVAPLLDEFKEISDQWLASKRAREKGFSLGAFDSDYLTSFDCAVVRHGGRIVAFANLWMGGGLHELSMDLMRHRDDAPKGTMMFLLLNLMLAGKRWGCQWFNLGMAPLAGLTRHRLAPKWHLVGRIIFTHGERLYGFEGLRTFKAQFHPIWRPRYIVCRPGIVSLARSLTDSARLISSAPTLRLPARPGAPALRRAPLPFPAIVRSAA